MHPLLTPRSHIHIKWKRARERDRENIIKILSLRSVRTDSLRCFYFQSLHCHCVVSISIFYHWIRALFPLTYPLQSGLIICLQTFTLDAIIFCRIATKIFNAIANDSSRGKWLFDSWLAPILILIVIMTKRSTHKTIETNEGNEKGSKNIFFIKFILTVGPMRLLSD